MSARVKWITFDCFGTLVDWQAGFTAALDPIAGSKTADVLRAYHVHERTIEREQPHRSYKNVLVRALVRAAADCDLPLSASAARVLPEAWSLMPVFGDVEPMLAELRANGWRLAVLTNCDEDLFQVTHGKFSLPFDLVLTAERVRGYKPSLWHFNAFERLTHVDRRDWVHVANSWYHDIEPAQALGIQHVWLDRDRQGLQGATSAVHVLAAPDVVAAVDWLFDGRPQAEAVACC